MLRITLSANGSLYCCSDGVRGRGAAVKYLSHNASFHSKEKIAPSNRGIKQLGSLWENGYCESFYGRMRDELLNGEIFYSLHEAQIIIERWRNHYNTKRPHSALGYRPPAPEATVPMDQKPIMH